MALNKLELIGPICCGEGSTRLSICEIKHSTTEIFSEMINPWLRNNIVESTAVSLIQESYADGWSKEDALFDVDSNGLFSGLDYLTEEADKLIQPSTSHESLENDGSIGGTCVARPLKQCDYCDYSTPLMYNLNRHIARNHLQNYSYPCTQCDRRFKDRAMLSQHENEVHNNSEPKLSCSYCHKKFKRRHDRDRHENLAHNPQNTFACPHCASLFTTSSNCQRHIKKRCELRPMNK